MILFIFYLFFIYYYFISLFLASAKVETVQQIKKHVTQADELVGIIFNQIRKHKHKQTQNKH